MKIKCIYCLKDKSRSAYRRREHVMPQCYGAFSPNNLILYETVCDECNQYFGENIELYLGRDTIEGVTRYRYGIKPRESPKRHIRLKFKISGGELKGMIVIPKYTGVPGENAMEMVLQVGFFRKDDQEYDYFEPQDIPSGNELREQDYELENEKIRLIAKNAEEMNYLIKMLKEKGMDVRPEEEMKWPEYVKDKNQILAEGIIRIDRIIYRALSKIGFNYLAYVAGKDFTLFEDFHGIRNFIRYNEGNSDHYFFANEPPILYFDRIFRRYNIKETNGHLVVAEWKGMNLIAKVSIFNMTTYSIRLCRNFKGIWRPIKCGHHFDVNSKEVSKLTAIGRELMP